MYKNTFLKGKLEMDKNAGEELGIREGVKGAISLEIEKRKKVGRLYSL